MTGGPGVGWTCADPSAITYYTETMLPKVRQLHHGAKMRLLYCDDDTPRTQRCCFLFFFHYLIIYRTYVSVGIFMQLFNCLNDRNGED